MHSNLGYWCFTYTYVLTSINIWPWGSLTVDRDLVRENLKFIFTMK